MANLPPQTPEPLPDLLRSIVDQAQTFAHAELELLKIESRKVATRAAVAVMVLTASGLLLSLSLCFVVAAVVLAQGGSAAAAVLSAAGVGIAVAALGTALMIRWVRDSNTNQTSKPATEAASKTQLTNMPQHGSTVS